MMGVIIPMDRLRKRMGKKEYIEREAIMQKFADHVKRSNNSDFAPVPTWNQAVQIVEDFPAADVRPVVTCADCKHNNACLTQAFVEDASRVPFDSNTFFCADGKRADDV